MSGGRVPLRIVAMIAVPCILVGVAAGASAALARGHATPRRAGIPAENAGPAAGAPEARNVVIAGPTTARLADDDRAALRALIRDELAATAGRSAAQPVDGAGAGGARAASNGELSNESPLSGRDLKTYDRVRAAVDDGVARGVWTEENRAQVHADIRTLPAERAMEVVRPLLVALNQGQLHFEGSGPLF
jgi:hypothetical protein